MILADEFHYGKMGIEGRHELNTPNLDRFAAQGAFATDAYAACPASGPSRAALLTGRHPQGWGFEFNESGPGRTLLPPSEPILPERLRSAGYATGLVGKWSLGLTAANDPLAHGFDEFYGFLDGMSGYVPAAGRTLRLRRDRIDVVETEYLTDAVTREGLTFIDRHRDRPFFLQIAHHSPHLPLKAPSCYQENGAGMIAALDHSVGAILNRLESHGLDHDTLVIFAGDKDCTASEMGRNTSPRNDSQNGLNEGDLRVPLLARWPGRIAAGSHWREPISLIDLAPTCVALAGALDTSDQTFDGSDLSSLFAHGIVPDPRPLHWRFGKQSAIREGRFKLLRMGVNEPWRLHDLQAGGETKDLARDYADVALSLEKKWTNWNATLSSRGQTVDRAPSPSDPTHSRPRTPRFSRPYSTT